MSSIFVFRRFPILGIGALSVLFPCLAGAAELPQRQSPPISPVEVTTLIKLLEQAQINRAAVRPSDFAAVVEDYMAMLDPERTFFLVTDRDALNARHAWAIYGQLGFEGSLVAGLDIFDVYDPRVDGRINWIGRKLGEEPDFSVDEKQSLATPLDWPTTASEAEELWRLRLKAECLNEILNEQSRTVSRATVPRRYEDIHRHRVELNPTERAELFLSVICRLFDPPTDYFSARTC
jgi:carboxyl-terminal processing protease